MRLSPITTVVAVGLSAAMTFATWQYDTGAREAHIAITVGVAIGSLVMLMMSIGVRYDTGRRSILMRIVSSVFTLVTLVLLGLLTLFDAGPVGVSLTLGPLLLIFLLVLYLVHQAAEQDAAPVRPRREQA